MVFQQKSNCPINKKSSVFQTEKRILAEAVISYMVQSAHSSRKDQQVLGSIQSPSELSPSSRILGFSSYHLNSHCSDELKSLHQRFAQLHCTRCVLLCAPVCFDSKHNRIFCGLKSSIVTKQSFLIKNNSGNEDSIRIC